LIRKDDDRSHIYTAGIKEEETQSALVDRVLETAFGGSALKLVMRTLGSRSASKEELKKIREYLDKIERGEK
jgi:predicted transcriptional regulator